ncbi:MAG: M48 family metallopeptidase [Chloroflexi bacterium]|nr:M48 family metallopeptidase [Chloroflexota bacterium]MCL5110164.1 M48 family metallopeptidase [Chloroflexota bacterium]
MDAPKIDRERQRTAKAYAGRQRRLYLLSLVLSALVVVLAVAINPFRWLEPAPRAGWPYLGVSVYFVLLMLFYQLVTLPLSYYSGHVLPTRYGLSVQSAAGWFGDLLKSTALGLVFGLVLVDVIYFLLANAPATWWLWAAGAVLLFTVVLANLSPILILPLFYKLRPLEDEDLVRRLTALAQRAGTKVRGVYTMDMSSRTTAANAALMGLGNTRRIVLGDTLLREYSPEEIESILAHELGHHVHRDIPKGIVVQTAVIVLSFWLADLALRWGVGQLALGGVADPAGLPLFGLVVGGIGFVAMPLTNGFTRWLETQADRYAIEATGSPSAFAAAMTRLANQNLADVDPPRWVEVLLYDHPAIGRRLALAAQYAQRLT